mmetsp:Transcript_9525/g.24286  ORF Transcript_9525/g.24286 Transcript_9525/m.24286 type:complete len:236 (+) Transcript_9525:4813-5520(+)
MLAWSSAAAAALRAAPSSSSSRAALRCNAAAFFLASSCACRVDCSYRRKDSACSVCISLTAVSRRAFSWPCFTLSAARCFRSCSMLCSCVPHSDCMAAMRTACSSTTGSSCSRASTCCCEEANSFLHRFRASSNWLFTEVSSSTSKLPSPRSDCINAICSACSTTSGSNAKSLSICCLAFSRSATVDAFFAKRARCCSWASRKLVCAASLSWEIRATVDGSVCPLVGTASPTPGV